MVVSGSGISFTTSLTGTHITDLQSFTQKEGPLCINFYPFLFLCNCRLDGVTTGPFSININSVNPPTSRAFTIGEEDIYTHPLLVLSLRIRLVPISSHLNCSNYLPNLTRHFNTIRSRAVKYKENASSMSAFLQTLEIFHKTSS